MKTANLFFFLGLLVVAGLAMGVAGERQACRKLAAQNEALRRQLLQLASLAAENQQLSNLVAQESQAGGAPGKPGAAEGRTEELAQLRRQVAGFQQQSNAAAQLRADTEATRKTLEATRREHRAQLASRSRLANASGSPLEILAASYGTERTNLDVTAGLGDRVRHGVLRMVANNEVAGDPDFGHVKALTVVYRFGGVTQTNEFREGEVVLLPPEPQ